MTSDVRSIKDSFLIQKDEEDVVTTQPQKGVPETLVAVMETAEEKCCCLLCLLDCATCLVIVSDVVSCLSP